MRKRGTEKANERGGARARCFNRVEEQVYVLRNNIIFCFENSYSLFLVLRPIRLPMRVRLQNINTISLLRAEYTNYRASARTSTHTHIYMYTLTLHNTAVSRFLFFTSKQKNLKYQRCCQWEPRSQRERERGVGRRERTSDEKKNKPALCFAKKLNDSHRRGARPFSLLYPTSPFLLSIFLGCASLFSLYYPRQTRCTNTAVDAV